MPAGYAATTGVESHLGDDFAFEISDLRVAERLPSQFPPPPASPSDVYVQPAPPLPEPGGKQTRRPSNIVPIRTQAPDPANDMFYLGLDLTFVGTELGNPGMPSSVTAEVRFFLEAYGVVGTAGRPERHEINIAPQTFAGLNTDPDPAAPGGGILRHQLWVQVAEPNLAGIIEAPVPPSEPWDQLFTPGTVYKIAASVKIVDCVQIPVPCPCLAGFIEGASMNTIECPK